MKNLRWTVTESIILKYELTNSRGKIRSIARKMGRSIKAIEMKAHRLGISKRKHKKEALIREMKRLLKMGNLSNVIIAQRLGINRATVAKYRRCL